MTAAVDEARKIGKAEAIYRRLKGEIEDGTLPPGEPLAELMVVERTGASRTPVREALRRLAADGLVDFTPRQGATVARISLQSARELFEFRMILEPAAMRLVAPLAAQEGEFSSRLRNLDRQLNRMRLTAPSAKRAREFYRLAEDFDRLIAAATPNTLLRRSILDLRAHTVRLRSVAHTAADRLETSLIEHQLMCQALLDGDPEAAEVTCREHLLQTVNTVFEALLSGSGAGVDLAPVAQVGR